MKTGDTDLIQTLNSGQVLGALTGSALLSVSAQGLVTAITADAESLLGLKEADVVGRPVSALPPALQKSLTNIPPAGANYEHSLDIQIPGRGKINVLVRIVPLSSGEKQIGGLIAVFQDATARKKIEQHLRRLNTLASIGTLSASMAHEIKNALVASKTFVELLLEKHPDDELCSIVRRENARIDAIVAQVLKFSAPGKGGFTSMSVHEALEHSLRLITPKLQAKSLTLERQFSARNDMIEGDAYQLQQAFVNLFLNSIDATPSHGKLSVLTQAADTSDAAIQKLAPNGDNAYVKLTIADTGEGIPPDNLPHIFEPFFTTKRTGTGLGLSITRGIIEEHDGVIIVESKPKSGAHFTILLPLVEKA